MSERYWITGVQLGILEATQNENDRIEIVSSITDKRFIDNITEPYEEWEIIAKKDGKT